MKSREEELAAKLRVYLDQAATDLRPGIAYRLQQARAQAVARLTENPQEAASERLVGAHGLLGAGAGGGNLPTGQAQRPLRSHGRLWLALGVAALAVLGWQQWSAWQEQDDLEDLDAQILLSDLPVGALTDRGFRLFLEIAPPPMPAPVDPDEMLQPVDAPAEGVEDLRPGPADPLPTRGLAPVTGQRVA